MQQVKTEDLSLQCKACGHNDILCARMVTLDNRCTYEGAMSARKVWIANRRVVIQIDLSYSESTREHWSLYQQSDIYSIGSRRVQRLRDVRDEVITNRTRCEPCHKGVKCMGKNWERPEWSSATKDVNTKRCDIIF